MFSAEAMKDSLFLNYLFTSTSHHEVVLAPGNFVDGVA
jgi:hypothetical protein